MMEHIRKLCFFAIIISIVGVHGWSGHVCSRKVVKYARQYYCSCRRLWWCCGRSSRTVPYYVTEKFCCLGWSHNGNKNCTIPQVIKNDTNTTTSPNYLTTEVSTEKSILTTNVTKDEEITTSSRNLQTSQTTTTQKNEETSTKSSKDTKPMETTFVKIEDVPISRVNISSQQLMTPTEIPQTTTEKELKNGKTFSCPKSYGYFVDGLNCKKYYHCSWYKAHSVTCPKGTHWNQTILTCDHGDNC